MKIIFVVILYLLCAAVVLQSIHVNKKIKRVRSRFILLLAVCLTASIMYSVLLYIRDAKLAGLLYTIYYSLESVIVLYITLVCKEYTGYGKNKLWISSILSFLVLLDCITMLSLELFGEFVSIVEKPVLFSGTALVPETLHPYFNIHIAMEYGLILVGLIMLLVKSCVVPREYHGKYSIIFYGLCMGLLGKTVLLLLNPVVDCSLIIYVLIAIVSYYIAINYVGAHMNLSTAKTVFNELDDLIVCFDFENNCTYVNKKIAEYIKSDNVKDLCTAKMKDWLSENPGFNDWRGEVHSWEMVIENEESKLFLNVRGQKNYDNMGNYLGCFFQLKDITEITRNYRERQKRLLLDPLTAVYRREYFFDRVKEILINGTNKKYSMICTNIVGFSVYNSIFGEEQGNLVLRRNGELICNMSDATVAYGRVFGDIFGILVETDSFRDSYITDMAKRLKEEFDGKNYNLRIMAGIYDIDNINEPVSSMCDKACMAIDSYKQEYNRIICRYNHLDYDETLNETVIMSRFQEALKTGQFQIFIQPQVTADERVIGGEALSRWVDNNDKIIPPVDFIPVLEKNGAIYKLDKYIWELAAKKLAEWKKKKREDLHISVNISAKDFYYIDVYEVFTGLVKKYDINPSNLKLEITESVIVQDTNTINEIIQGLRNFGFDIEIDDFGSGYSSLGMLKDIVVDVLKLDMSFLRKASTTQEERMWLIMEQMVHLAEALGMETVVEGVETRQQADRLNAMGCKVFQGYLFAKPEPVRDFEKRANV